MIAITAYSIPSLFMNGGTGVCTAYLVLVLLNVVFRATGFMNDFDVGTVCETLAPQSRAGMSIADQCTLAAASIFIWPCVCVCVRHVCEYLQPEPRGRPVR